MVILYFLGGQDPFLEKGIAVTCRAIHEAGGHPRVLFLPWGLDRDEAAQKVPLIRSAFSDLGGDAEAAWPEDGEKALRKILTTTDLVYLADGNARTMLHHMRSSGMKGLLQNYEGVVVGDAAGGMIMCRHVIMPPDQYSSTYSMILGLNMVDFGIVPRYRRDMDQFVVGSSAGRTVFGVPEGSALMYGAGILSHYGPVHMFKLGKRTILTDKLSI